MFTCIRMTVEGSQPEPASDRSRPTQKLNHDKQNKWGQSGVGRQKSMKERKVHRTDADENKKCVFTIVMKFSVIHECMTLCVLGVDGKIRPSELSMMLQHARLCFWWSHKLNCWIYVGSSPANTTTFITWNLIEKLLTYRSWTMEHLHRKFFNFSLASNFFHRWRFETQI